MLLFFVLVIHIIANHVSKEKYLYNVRFFFLIIFVKILGHDNAYEYIANNYLFLKKEVPECTNPETCPLKIPHAPNGETFAIGCAACDYTLQTGQSYNEIDVSKPNYVQRDLIIENIPQNIDVVKDDFANRKQVNKKYGNANYNRFLPLNEVKEDVDKSHLMKKRNSKVGGRIADLLKKFEM